jgi:hypothetical protein
MTGLFVCVAGRSGAGKDTLAERLVAHHGFHRVAIADPLKELTGRAFDLDREQLWGAQRNVVDARWELTPRQLYQKLGDALHRRGEIWTFERNGAVHVFGKPRSTADRVLTERSRHWADTVDSRAESPLLRLVPQPA